jgi:hypothetical protein
MPLIGGHQLVVSRHQDGLDDVKHKQQQKDHYLQM